MPKLRIEAGDDTGDLVEFITRELDDATLDETDVERELAPQSGLASEPITAAAVLTLTSVAAISVARLIERWMETRRQERAMKLVAEGFETSDAVGKALAKLAEAHAKVSVQYTLPNSGKPDSGKKK